MLCINVTVYLENWIPMLKRKPYGSRPENKIQIMLEYSNNEAEIFISNSS